jgi:WhiB family redox-sensing transcriptional regulator
VNDDWMTEGLCTQTDPDLWFPGKGVNATVAKTICAACPVITQCGDAGLHEIHGIWGGLTRHDRKNLLRRQARAALAQQLDTDAA